MDSPQEKNGALLLFRVGPVLCCAPSAPVEAMITPRPLTRTPGANPGEPGMFRHAGHIVSAFDLRSRFGVEKAARTEPGRFIIAAVTQGRVGFHVDEIIEVIGLPNQGWGALPPLLPRGVFSRTLLWQEKIWLYAEFEHLRTISGDNYLRQYIQHLQTQTPATPDKPAGTAAQPAARAGRADSANSKASGNATVNRPAQQAPQTHDKVRPASQTISSPTDSHKTTRPGDNTRFTHSNPTDRSAHRTSAGRDKARSALRSSSAAADTHKVSAAADRIPTSPTHTRQHAPSVKPVSNPEQQALPPSRATTGAAHTREQTLRTPSADRSLTRPPATPASANTPPVTRDSAEQTAGFGSMLVMTVLVLGLLGGIGYGTWYLVSPAQPPVGNRLTSNPPAPTLPMPAIQETSSQAVAAAPDPITPVQQDSSTTTVAQSDKHTDANQARTPPSPTEPAADQASLHASIERDAQGIIITLDVPEDDPIFQQAANASPEPTKDPAATDSSQPEDENTSAAARDAVTPAAGQETPAPPADTAKPQSDIDRVEITHIVVPGDTLWHIAERYVNNPYRYPELARLSNISNPDLIYPGDRVRILKRKRKKTDDPA